MVGRFGWVVSSVWEFIGCWLVRDGFGGIIEVVWFVLVWVVFRVMVEV